MELPTVRIAEWHVAKLAGGTGRPADRAAGLDEGASEAGIEVQVQRHGHAPVGAMARLGDPGEGRVVARHERAAGLWPARPMSPNSMRCALPWTLRT